MTPCDTPPGPPPRRPGPPPPTDRGPRAPPGRADGRDSLAGGGAGRRRGGTADADRPRGRRAPGRGRGQDGGEEGTPRSGRRGNQTPAPTRRANGRPPPGRRPLARPAPGRLTRFQPRPDRPSPQSQSFSRSYGSGLPTSLTYIVLSTRGCSPWRPAAVMGTTRGDGPRTPPHFQGPAGARRTPPETRRSTGPQPLAPDKPIPGIPPLTKKRKLFPGPRPASAGSLALQLGPPRRTEGSACGFGNIDPIPFRPGGEAPPRPRRGAPAAARSGTSLGLRID